MKMKGNERTWNLSAARRAVLICKRNWRQTERAGNEKDMKRKQAELAVSTALPAVLTVNKNGNEQK